MKYNQIMVDIETLGNTSNSVIIGIAAVRFDIKTGETSSVFFEKVSLQSCLDRGLKISEDTLKWWLNQKHDTLTKLLECSHPLPEVLDKLQNFIHKTDIVWGNSNRFDLGLLQDAYMAVNKATPWHFRNERDVRTIAELKPEIKANMPFEGSPHNPLSDCYHQIKYLVRTLNSL